MVTYAGWQLEVRIASSLDGLGASNSQVGGIQRITWDYVQNLDRKEAIGRRTVYAITEGVIGLTGTIERFWTGSGTDSWTRGANETGSLTEYYIGVYPNGYSSGQPKIILNNVKFGRRRMLQRPGSNLLTETLDFIGQTVTTGSV